MKIELSNGKRLAVLNARPIKAINAHDAVIGSNGTDPHL